MKTYTKKQITKILGLHERWVNEEKGGVKANLSKANLSGVDLSWANLSGADLSWTNLSGASLCGAGLSGANLYEANLSGASLYGANLYEANLSGADLSKANLFWANLYGANLSRANLYEANLSGAGLSRANLSRANLSGANLCETNLLCLGNKKQIKTLQFDEWSIGYTKDTLQIGCQRHPIEKWKKWKTEAGKVWVSKMDVDALTWAEKYLDLVLTIIDKSPAEE